MALGFHAVRWPQRFAKNREFFGASTKNLRGQWGGCKLHLLGAKLTDSFSLTPCNLYLQPYMGSIFRVHSHYGDLPTRMTTRKWQPTGMATTQFLKSSSVLERSRVRPKSVVPQSDGTVTKPTDFGLTPLLSKNRTGLQKLRGRHSGGRHSGWLSFWLAGRHKVSNFKLSSKKMRQIYIKMRK